jgi:enamine deaminase RidA (YjgF/YER057c/UK114 family)
MTPRARRTIVTPPGLQPPRGFNHGIVVEGGRLLFLAGQDASGADGLIVAPGDLVGQFDQVLQNLRAVVETAGGTMTDVAKINIYVLDRDEYMVRRPALGDVYRRYFGKHYPAMALFEVSRLYNDGALIEIEGLAVLDVPPD